MADAEQILVPLRSTSTNTLERDIIIQTTNISTLMQSPNATQQVYKPIADGEWADRFGPIAEIMDEWLQNSHLPLLTARFINPNPSVHKFLPLWETAKHEPGQGQRQEHFSSYS